MMVPLLEVPELASEAEETPPAPAAVTAGGAKRWRRGLRSFVRWLKSSRGRESMPVQPEMQPLDYLARDFPHLYTWVACH
ncbi:hypothetical protein D6833_09470 [Candidatus Parcubacteria bacterium]|nr:MAG: hypothetical protein D6833_09470 [Candidatus Parcubacteria bacterium]